MQANDLFVRCLENEGVEYIFGIPGEENFDADGLSLHIERQKFFTSVVVPLVNS